jgi:signal transduction histidine kinase
LRLELEDFDFSSSEGIQKANAYFLEQFEGIDALVHNLTTTIDDFRNFYKSNKQSVFVSFQEVTKKALRIIKTSLINDNIKLTYHYNSDKKLELYDNEIMQVLLNLLKNAQDNFKEKDVENPEIIITTKENCLSICDNGGGIPESIVEKIFDPYFSTKSGKNGTGLGLSMSKTIIEEHHGGSLKVMNTDDGVCFKIEIGISLKQEKTCTLS